MKKITSSLIIIAVLFTTFTSAFLIVRASVVSNVSNAQLISRLITVKYIPTPPLAFVRLTDATATSVIPVPLIKVNLVSLEKISVPTP